MEINNSFRYIEFFGAPGVGKSTLFNNLISNNNQLWIGTLRGLRVLYSPSSMFTNPKNIVRMWNL